MALISVGSVDDFSVTPSKTMTLRRRSRFGDIDTLKVLDLASPVASFTDFQFPVSKQPRGLALKNLHLDPAAQKFFKRLFHLKSNIYVLSWAWDLSGEPATAYPDLSVGAPPTYIAMKGGGVQQFLGSGTVLFPARPIASGLQLRMQIWQSAKGVRTFGKTMSEISSAVEESDLNDLLRGISLAIPHAAIAKVAEEAAMKLVNVIGQILERRGDSMLDLYEGNFPATASWPRKPMIEKREGTQVELTPLR